MVPMFDFGRRNQTGEPQKEGSQYPGVSFPVISVYQNIQPLCRLWRTYDEILIMLLLHQRRLADQFAEAARVDLVRFAGSRGKKHQPGIGVPFEVRVLADKQFATVRPKNV